MKRCFLACLISAAFVAVPSMGDASFPGGNGRVAVLVNDGGYNIFALSPDGKEMEQLTDFSDAGWIWGMKWSPDGRRLAFATGGGAPELFVMNADGSDQKRLTFNNRRDASPAWSPDGTKLAFVRTVHRIDQIFIMNLVTRKVRRVTTLREDAADLAWSPDGTRIAFIGVPRDGAFEVFSIRPDGTRLRRLTPDAFAWGLSWSPDSRKLVFSDMSEAMDSEVSRKSCFPEWPTYVPTALRNGPCEASIYTIMRNGREKTKLTDEANLNVDPSWSPDGKSIVFLSDRASTPWFMDVYIMKADGSQQRQLRDMAGPTWLTDWQPLSRSSGP